MIDVIPSLEKERVEDIPNYVQIQKESGDNFGIIKSEESIQDLRKIVLEKLGFTVYSTEDDNSSETLVGSYGIE